jgi:integrase
MPRKKTRREFPKGIRRHGAGFQTYVRINGRLLPAKSWPADTEIPVMEAWVKEQKKLNTGDPVTGFAADIVTYCARKAALRSINLRRGHLEFIAAKIGADRPRQSITTTELDKIFAQLQLDGMEISTVHNYRASIRAFFNVMDPDRVNPVKGTELPGIPTGAAKARRFDVIESILSKMTDRGRAKLRANVMAFTGIPPALLMKVTAADLQPSPLAPTEVRCSPRRKGTGVEARVLPLTEDGSKAFAAFHLANAYGSFAVTGLNTAFKLAAGKAGIESGISVYTLRHSFLTQLYRDTLDLATVARFAMHAEGSPLTAQYAKGANDEVDAAAVAAFNASARKRRQAQAGPVEAPALDWTALAAVLSPALLAQVRAAVAPAEAPAAALEVAA